MIILLYKQLLNISISNNLFTGISAISTSIATLGGLSLLFVNFLMFNETRKQRIAQEEPVVTLRLIPDVKNSNFLNFHFKNSGGGAAYDINIILDPDIPYGNSTLNKLPMFKRTPLLEKGEEVIFFYDSAISYFNSDNPKSVNAKITYYTYPKDNRASRKIIRNIEINLDEREGQMQIIQKDLTDLVKEIEELKHALIISRIEGKEDD